MFGHYAYQYLAARNDQGNNQGNDQGNDQNGKQSTTKVSVIYVTASPTFTGPIAGYTTLGPSSQTSSQSSSTSSSNAMTTSSAKPNTSSQPSSSSSSIEVSVSAKSSSKTQEPTPTTESIAEPSSSVSITESISVNTPMPVIASPTSESSGVSSPVVESPTSLAVDHTSSAVVENLLATSLEDLPLYIASPTAIAPVSVPLLVATSSTSIAILKTSAPQPSKVIQYIAPTASATAKTNPTSMTASGKVSLIFGITLLVGAACLMYQLYFRKQRQAERERRRTEDSEKQSFGKPGAGKRISSISMSPTISLQKPSPAYPAVPAKDIKLQPENHRENPFGNHAEIVVDPVNASGPRQIERVNSETPVLTRVASKKGYVPQKFTTNGPNKVSRTSASTEYSVTSMAPGSMPVDTPTSAAIQAAGGPVSTVYRVQLDFSPSMDDELELRSGQLIRVLHEFDDGWAMCLRLDRSEQGVCPRTCLSSRPVKPRSQSNSSQGRLPPQSSHSFHSMPNQANSTSLPTSPQELSAIKAEPKSDRHSGPQRRPGHQQYVTSQNNNLPNTPAQMNTKPGPTNPQPTSLSGENIALPLSQSATRTVNHSSLTQQKPETTVPAAPIDDYFSFTKPNPEPERADMTPTDNPSSPHHQATGSSIGIPSEFLSQASSQQKPIPGQAL